MAAKPKESKGWGGKPGRKPTVGDSVDAFVRQSGEEGSTARLHARIPVDLHRRCKAGCALEGRTLSDVLIELLEARFPAPPQPHRTLSLQGTRRQEEFLSTRKSKGPGTASGHGG